MKSWLRNALLILTLVTGTGAIARAQVQEGETPPQNRMFYVRALAGVGYYYRFEGVSEYGFGFSYGGEAGFGLIHVRSGEFDTVGLGVHLDRFSLNTEQVETRQTFVLGQVTFMKSSDIGAYFGPEAGVRQVNNNGVDMGSGFVAGLFGGVEIPLTTHLTYGPQLEVLYAFDVPFQLNSISGFESNLIGRVFLAVTYHL